MSALRTATRAALIIALVSPGAAMAQDPAAGAPASTPPTGTIPVGVSVAGMDVSGLSATDASAKILSLVVLPRRQALTVTFRGRALQIDPDAVGYRADVGAAVQSALAQAPAPGATVDVPLPQKIDRATLKGVLGWRAGRVAVPARDATVRLVGLTPKVTRATFGYSLDVATATTFLATRLLEAHPATPYALPATRVKPTRTSVGMIIVVSRSQFKLRLYNGQKRIRTYPVAVGQPAYPTPTGNYQIIEKQVDPTWFPPSSPWAAGLGPIPPGGGNPLGTRWIGTSAPGIGMHGTPNSSSIGSAASHGCIRMYIGDAENLYPRVEVGTPVFIR